MFDSKSRYLNADTYDVTDHRGRQVTVVTVPDPPEENLLGYHLRLQGQRLNHMAHHYLDDGAGFWRICEKNEVMTADALSETAEIAIPGKK